MSYVYLAIALAMDVFALSLVVGISAPSEKYKQLMLRCAIYFGGFQGVFIF